MALWCVRLPINRTERDAIERVTVALAARGKRGIRGYTPAWYIADCVKRCQGENEDFSEISLRRPRHTLSEGTASRPPLNSSRTSSSATCLPPATRR